MTAMPVVVGVDGSPHSLHAVDWAAAAARRHGAPLRIVFAPATQPPIHGCPGAPQKVAAILRDFVRPGAQRGAAARPGRHRPRGLATLGREHVMQGQEHRAEPRIVAAVDGSPASISALGWAIRQARVAGATVDAVIAWHCPVAGGFGWTPMGVGGSYDFRASAEQVLANAIKSAGPAGGVSVRARACQGDPALVLLGVCDGADLLVMGSRGHGGLVEALLGSVSQYCVQHAPCPVVVIGASTMTDRQPA